MRPHTFAIAALTIELFFSAVCLAGSNVASLKHSCIVQHAEFSVVQKCVQISLQVPGSNGEANDRCVSDMTGSIRGGTLESICEQQVAAQCAAVNYFPGAIMGCEKYGTPVGNAGADGGVDISVLSSTNPNSGDGHRSTAEVLETGAAAGLTGSQQESSPVSGATESHANADIQACQTAQSQASQCCNNPSSCSTSSSSTPAPAPDMGLSAACQQMQKAAFENARANNAAAANCSSRSSACNSACVNLITKYSSRASSSAAFQRAVEIGQNAKRTCGGFASIVRKLGQQASSSADSSAAGLQCGANTAINPSSLGALAGGGGSESGGGDDPYGCATNPTSPACQGNPMAAPPVEVSTAGFSSGSGKEKPVFNIDPTTLSDGGPSFSGSSAAKAPGAANVVANNAGGAMPGGGGASAASLGGAGSKGKPTPGSPGYTTDVMQGDRSGGYSQPASQPVLDDGLSGGLGGRQGSGRLLGRGLASVGGVDLKQYLPGANLDPNRRLGGLAGGRQILGRFDDMWRNVSNRYSEKCKLGILLDCR